MVGKLGNCVPQSKLLPQIKRVEHVELVGGELDGARGFLLHSDSEDSIFVHCDEMRNLLARIADAIDRSAETNADDS